MRPLPAFALGWSGVIPFAALSAATVAGVALPWSVPPAAALVAYAAAILAFMGGVQWGVAMGSPRLADAWSGYGASVLPALLAAAALLLPARPALIALVAGFAALLAYDLRTVRAGDAPPWYARLRWQLTAAAVLLLLAASAAA